MAFILVVEDDRGIRELFMEILLSEGHEIAFAEDGNTALRLARSLQPDLILMDLMLPVLDGIAATCRLKADRDTTDIPIIATSAKPTLLREAEETADHVLPKPFDVRAFIDVVDHCLDLPGW
jgi:CheY-like chemotaxis protein